MRIITIAFLSCFLLISHTPNASAAVGLAIKNRTVRVVGAVVTAAGAGSLAISSLIASTIGSYTAVGFAILSVPVALTGFVILDEKNADLKFGQISEEKARLLKVTREEVAVYNSEVEELNVVKEMIESRVTEKSKQAVIDRLWQEYKDTLSPETLKVAAQITIKVLAQK